MTQVVREALDKLEDVLLRGGQDGQDLADILSALRGPDILSALRGPDRMVDEENFKMRTTGPVRSMVFPRLFKARINKFYADSIQGRLKGYFPMATACWGMRSAEEFSLRLTDGKDHFTDHISRAIEAIKRT